MKNKEKCGKLEKRKVKMGRSAGIGVKKNGKGEKKMSIGKWKAENSVK